MRTSHVMTSARASRRYSVESTRRATQSASTAQTRCVNSGGSPSKRWGATSIAVRTLASAVELADEVEQTVVEQAVRREVAVHRVVVALGRAGDARDLAAGLLDDQLDG